MGRTEEIRLIAYQIWEEEYYCHGHDVEHWLKAEAIWEEKQLREKSSTNFKTESKTMVSKSKSDNKQTHKKH